MACLHLHRKCHIKWPFARTNGWTNGWTDSQTHKLSHKKKFPLLLDGLFYRSAIESKWFYHHRQAMAECWCVSPSEKKKFTRRKKLWKNCIRNVLRSISICEIGTNSKPSRVSVMCLRRKLEGKTKAQLLNANEPLQKRTKQSKTKNQEFERETGIGKRRLKFGSGQGIYRL